MVTVKEQHLEWALKHLQKYSHSDFFPRMFELQAIFHNWLKVKEYILAIDLSQYVPKPAIISLAYKNNRTYRIVHQLEPIDTFIYTALIREICEIIEDYRIPKSENIACSYRIEPDLEGSFFSSETGWDTFLSKSEALSVKYESGYVLVCDITDFYNQIYIHRVNNLISEAGRGTFDTQAEVIHEFLLNLNNRASRGIPVGPKASIIIAELIMASIDNYIHSYTTDFVRYVDDIRIFFNTREEAVFALHDLTSFLHSYHRLVLSGEKTKIRTAKRFRKDSLRDEEKEENSTIMAKADELATGKIEELLENLPPYSEDIDYEEEYEKAFQEIMADEKFELLSSTYADLFQKSLENSLDFPLLRHILRKAARYRIRSIVTLVLDNFERLLPLIREMIIYLNRVINDEVVTRNKTKFEAIVSAYYTNLPFINLWIARLLSNKCFNTINLPANYNNFCDIRSKSIIALRRQDTTWVRGFRDKVSVLGPWDKRAVIYSSSLLPLDEMKSWIGSVAASGDIVDKSIASFLISQKKSIE